MYAYLRIERRAYDRIAFPDGGETLVERGAGIELASAWRVTQAADAADDTLARQQAGATKREEARRAHEQRHAEWQRQLNQVLDRGLSITHVRSLHAKFTDENPEPTLDASLAEEPETTTPDALGIPVPTVTAERCWVAELAEVEEETEIVIAPDGPYPRAAVARAISDLERRGWSVVHVAEDRVVTHSENDAQVHVVSAWLLLHAAD